MNPNSSAPDLSPSGDSLRETSLSDESRDQAQIHRDGQPDSVYLSIRVAGMEHLAPAKKLADKHKYELGFINRAILQKAIESRALLVAPCPDVGNSVDVEPVLAGMLHYYVRRDTTVTLCNIVVAPTYQRVGLGRRLFEELVRSAGSLGKTQIRLKCPTDLQANLFYERLGLRITTVEPGKHRMLNVWSYIIHEQP